jgi:hypothetical protein
MVGLPWIPSRENTCTVHQLTFIGRNDVHCTYRRKYYGERGEDLRLLVVIGLIEGCADDEENDGHERERDIE